MRQTVLIVIIAAALMALGCQRKDKAPKPTISMVPLVQMAA